MKYLESLIELFNWVRIFISPFLIFGSVGFVLYKKFEGGTGIGLFVLFVIIGLVLGVYFAEKVRKKVGATNFITKTTPWEDVKKEEGTVKL